MNYKLYMLAFLAFGCGDKEVEDSAVETEDTSEASEEETEQAEQESEE